VKPFGLSIACWGAVMFVIVAAGFSASLRAAPGPILGDVVGHWSQDLVRSAVEAGYVHGYPDGTFRPDGPVTRAEALKLIAAGLGVGPVPGVWQPFADLDGHWLAGHGWIQAAVQAGIFPAEKASGRFEPDSPAAREDLAKWAVRVLRGGTAARTWSGVLGFRDAAAVSRVPYVGLAADRGIIVGYPDGTFRPQGGATRAEAVAVVERARRQPPFDFGRVPDGSVPAPPGSPDWRGRVLPNRTFRQGDALSLRLLVLRGPREGVADRLAEGTAAVRVVAADAAGAVLEAAFTGLCGSPDHVVSASQVRYWYAAGAWEVVLAALDPEKAGFGDWDFWALVFFPGPVGPEVLSGMGETASVNVLLPGEPGRAEAVLEVAGYGVDDGVPVAVWAVRVPPMGVQGVVRVDAERPWTRTGTLERLQADRWEKRHWHVVTAP